MLEHSKRSGLPLYVTLPLVAILIWCVLAVLAERQRWHVISRLSHATTHGTDSEATAAVRKMAMMPHPPIRLLATSAASIRRPVAVEAQQSINKLLRRWQRQVKHGEAEPELAGQVSKLAAALARSTADFSRKDSRWVDKTAHKLLRLGEQLPTPAPATLSADCQMLLASLETIDEPATLLATATPVVEVAPEVPGESSHLILDDDGGQNLVDLTPVSGGPVRSDTLMPIVDVSSDKIPAELSDPGFVMRSTKTGDGWVATDVRPVWQPAWSRPAVNEQTTPLALQPVPGTASQSAPDDVTPSTALADLESRELLRRWSDEEAADREAVQQELGARGFWKLSLAMVEKLFHEKASVRLSLLEEIVAAPDVDPRPWLLLLADDASADVRLATVEAMAASNDPLLIEKAWEVSRRDRDPRIATQARRLREQRDLQYR